MAALRIHQHRIDGVRIALPFEPRPFRPPGEVGRLALLDHHAFDDRMRRLPGASRRGLPSRRTRPRGERSKRRRIERADESLEAARAARVKGSARSVLVALLQKVVAAHEHRILLAHLRRHGLAVQPLLQVGERAGPLRRPADQQLAVERGVEIHRVGQVGKGAGNVVAGARIEPAHAALADHLDADAVPFPFGRIVGRVELFEIALARPHWTA